MAGEDAERLRSCTALTTKGPVQNKLAIWGPEAHAWQGARRANSRAIQPTSNTARRDGSEVQMVKLFWTGP